jgi:hypothetical protein
MLTQAGTAGSRQAAAAMPLPRHQDPVTATVPQLTAAAAGGEPSGEQPAADGGTAWPGTAA